MGGAAQQIIRRDAVVIAGPANEAEARFSGAVFIMAQQRLADPQIRRGLPLTDIAPLAQGRKSFRKMSVL